MRTVLLDLAEFREDHGIRPHSLKVPTISAIMGEIAKGNANLAQLAVQGNYRAAAAQDMGNAHSRNLAQQQIFVSRFDQNTFEGNTNAEGSPNDLPKFSEKVQWVGSSLNQEVSGKRPTDRDLSILRQRDHLDVLKRRKITTRSFLGKSCTGRPNRN